MIKLPESLRCELSRPYGRIYRDGERIFDRIEEVKKCSKFACVGDLVSRCAFLANLEPDIVVIDGKTLREKEIDFKLPESYERIYARNPAGFITSDLVRALRRAVEMALSNRKIAVIVDGEEDLAVIPLSLLMPESSLICYGQPGEGVVALVVDETLRMIVLKLLKQMLVLEEDEEIRRLG